MYGTIIVGGGSSGLQLGALLSGVEGEKGLFLAGDSTAAPGAGGDIGHKIMAHPS